MLLVLAACAPSDGPGDVAAGFARAYVRRPLDSTITAVTDGIARERILRERDVRWPMQSENLIVDAAVDTQFIRAAEAEFTFAVYGQSMDGASPPQRLRVHVGHVNGEWKVTDFRWTP